MPRGGARKGAGRPKTVAPGDELVPVMVHLRPDDKLELQAMCARLELSYGGVMVLGIEAAQKLAAKQDAREEAKAEKVRNRRG